MVSTKVVKMLLIVVFEKILLMRTVDIGQEKKSIKIFHKFSGKSCYLFAFLKVGMKEAFDGHCTSILYCKTIYKKYFTFIIFLTKTQTPSET